MGSTTNFLLVLPILTALKGGVLDPTANKTKQFLISALGYPYFETDTCILFCGDTLKMQEKLKDEMFDVIITSPPYNIGKEYENIKPLQDYINWSTQWISASSKILVSNGALLFEGLV